MASDVDLIMAIAGVKGVTKGEYRIVLDLEERAAEFLLSVELDEDEKHRCPICGRKCPGYDKGRGIPYMWRALDCNGAYVFIRCNLVRVRCPLHDVRTERVPFAYYKSQFTAKFDDYVAYLATTMPKSNITAMMRIDWQTVGRCLSRVLNYLEPDRKVRYNNLVNIGIDETSYKKGHKYITIVVDHDRNRLVWAGKGHKKEVLDTFFNELTNEQRASIMMVSADGAPWIWSSVEEHLPNAIRCIDPFHVVQWANVAVDEVRRKMIKDIKSSIENNEEQLEEAQDDVEKEKIQNELKAEKEVSKNLKRAKYRILKAQESLTPDQRDKLEELLSKCDEISRAHKFKERLRAILKMKNPLLATKALDQWIKSAMHSNLSPIKKLAKSIKKYRDRIVNSIAHGLSNARVEATNTKIKLLIRIARGFRNLETLADLAFLKCSDLRPPLPHNHTTLWKVA